MNDEYFTEPANSGHEHSGVPKVTLLPPGKPARDEYGHRYGSEVLPLTQEQLQSLLQGNQLAIEIMDGEYVLFVMKEDAEGRE